MTQDIFVVAAARTAIGTFGGALKDVPLHPAGDHRGARGHRAQRRRDPTHIGHVVHGQRDPDRPRDAYLSRVAAIEAGLPAGDAGLQRQPAVRLRPAGHRVGGAGAAVLGDCEHRDRRRRRVDEPRPVLRLPAARWGARMGDAQAVDYMLGILHDPFHKIHMGITAENVAARDGITREMQDALAAESQQRAARAIAEGRFKAQIVAGGDRRRARASCVFDTDEHVRADTTVEQLAKMKPAFKEGRHGHRRQRLGHQRRCGRAWCWPPATRVKAHRPEAAGAAGQLRAMPASTRR